MWNEYLARRDTDIRWIRRQYLPLATQINPGVIGSDGFELNLAESWTSEDAGATLRFQLRDIKWSDGTPLTPADVIYTWQAQTSTEVPWISATTKGRIQSVEGVADDPLAVRFKFDSPYAYQFADAVSGGIVPKHIFEAIPFGDWTTYDWSTQRVGSGPFVIDEVRPADGFEMVRNPNYYRAGHPHLDKVAVRIIGENSVLLTQLRNGEIDASFRLGPNDAEQLRSVDGVEVRSYLYPNIDLIGWNTQRAPFDNPKVRRAVASAIDRDGLIEEFLFGDGVQPATMVASIDAAANNQIERLDYAPVRAKQELRSLGFTAQGNPLKFRLMISSGNALRRDIATRIQNQLQTVGIQMEIDVVEPQAMNQALGAREFDGFLRGLVLTGNPDLGQVFHSGSPMNVMGYHTPELDQLFADIQAANDWSDKKELLDRAQSQIYEDQPFTYLYEMRGLAAHSSGLAGVRLDVPADPLARIDSFWKR